MVKDLPDAVAGYLKADRERDSDALLGWFTRDAEVTDEDRAYRGHAEIRRWREGAAAAYEYSVAVLGSEPVGTDGHVVRTRLEGNFPGGTVDLTYRFTLRDGLIAGLEIAP
ncbi:nuclear transport factor 2 family protein [Streptomyces sp. NPDC006923]|uniref:nuclear transport factor 2 family protein n=1 Tax=Streptomyces sp. NPDC006923 TaxID=3155355 RepID=UPI0033D8957C